MKVTMAAVTSLNGKLTQGNDPHIRSWTSDEDFEHFRGLIGAADCIVMGRKTYEVMKSSLKLQEGKLRIVLTRNPGDYNNETVMGRLEFSSEASDELVQRLSEKEFKQLLVVGGSEVNAMFLTANLIDELYVTIEPFLFGTGIPLVSSQTGDRALKLVGFKQLNSRGSILLTYRT